MSEKQELESVLSRLRVELDILQQKSKNIQTLRTVTLNHINGVRRRLLEIDNEH